MKPVEEVAFEALSAYLLKELFAIGINNLFGGFSVSV
jgi:hypothetical protein